MARRRPGSDPGGRPVRDFDKKTFEGLCHVQCTVDEIEAILHTDQRTIDNWCKREYKETFSTVYKRYAKGGKASVRRNQFALSKTNASVAIWLGKVMLGQKDPQEEDNKKAMGKLLGAAIDKLKEENNAESHPREETEDLSERI